MTSHNFSLPYIFIQIFWHSSLLISKEKEKVFMGEVVYKKADFWLVWDLRQNDVLEIYPMLKKTTPKLP